MKRLLVLWLETARVEIVGQVAVSPDSPHCEHYTGTDFSETALNHTRQMCQQLDNLGHVTLRKGSADDFSGFEANQFDTISSTR